eukprot:492840-Pleurochrysis_carterae.AAC.1
MHYCTAMTGHAFASVCLRSGVMRRPPFPLGSWPNLFCHEQHSKRGPLHASPVTQADGDRTDFPSL